MKASDLLNVLNHIPGDTEVPDIEIVIDGVNVPASEALAALKGDKDSVQIEP